MFVVAWALKQRQCVCELGNAVLPTISLPLLHVLLPTWRELATGREPALRSTKAKTWTGRLVTPCLFSESGEAKLNRARGVGRSGGDKTRARGRPGGDKDPSHLLFGEIRVEAHR